MIITYTLNLSIKKRIFSSISIILVLTLTLATPLSSVLFSAFEINTTVATNVLESNEQFSDIGFLPYLTKTTSENIMDVVKSPENYSSDSINT